VKIIAVGNAFYGDDGIGAAVLEHLRKERRWPDADLIDVGTDALAMLDHLDPNGWNVVVDAGRMGLAPGTVAAFGPDEVQLRIVSDHLSLHGFGLAEVFTIARNLGRLPRQLLIVGIEPAEVTIDRGLSPAVAAAIPRVISLINAEVHGDDSQDHPGH